MAQVYAPIDFNLWPVLRQVPAHFRERAVLVHVFGGGKSALFVTDDDSVYAVGKNEKGSLGIGDVDETPIPVEIPFLKNKKVKCFATGWFHTIALTESGDLFSWGSNDSGQLGRGTGINQRTPGRVLLQDGDRVEAIACGVRYSLALTANHKVLHWGNIQFTQQSVQTTLCELQINCSGFICEIACGEWHAAAITNEGEVYTWGENNFGQLGQEGRRRDVIPTLVDRSPSVPATSIGCGCWTTIILNSKGKLESWGAFKDLDKLDCPPIDSFVVSRDGVIAIKCGDKIFRYDMRALETRDYSPKRISGNCLPNAFAGGPTPQFLRAKASDPHTNATDQKVDEPTRMMKCNVHFDKKDNSDISVKLSDGVVYVHKLILTTFCEHFKTMLLGSWADETTKELDMTAYNPKAYRAFLKYIYCGTLEPLPGPELIELFMIAQAYLESDLKSMVVDTFRKGLKLENVAHFYSHAHDAQCEELMEICYKFTSGCLDEVVLSDAFDKLSLEHSKSLVKESTKKKNI